jgi:16S rRNA (guanine527-N7)-methyltransferase
MNIDFFLQILASNRFDLPDGAEKALMLYAALLKDWNAKINLISRKDEDNILEKHVLHSLVLRMPAVCQYDFANKRVADIGTGGGLPGIPLKIVTPSCQMALIDSVQKKIAACSAMIAELGLTEIEAISGRGEELAKQPAFSHAYDAVVSRAVAPLDELAKWSRGLLKPNGILFSLKGGDLGEEIRRTERLKFVAAVDSKPIELESYNGFAQEDKKVVSVFLKAPIDAARL